MAQFDDEEKNKQNKEWLLRKDKLINDIDIVLARALSSVVDSIAEDIFRGSKLVKSDRMHDMYEVENADENTELLTLTKKGFKKKKYKKTNFQKEFGSYKDRKEKIRSLFDKR